MARHTSSPKPRERGFSLIEVLIVVVIVLIMAAVALPNIGGYIKNYRIKGAAQLVAGEIQAARSRAIMSNTNSGVSFVVVDQDSFRFVQEDVEEEDLRLSALKTLPTGVVFATSGEFGGPDLNAPGATVRFLRLGGFCNPEAGGSCREPVPLDKRTRDADGTTAVDGEYLGADDNGNIVIRVHEVTTNLERTVQIAPGGRVLPQP